MWLLAYFYGSLSSTNWIHLIRGFSKHLRLCSHTKHLTFFTIVSTVPLRSFSPLKKKIPFVPLWWGSTSDISISIVVKASAWTVASHLNLIFTSLLWDTYHGSLQRSRLMRHKNPILLIVLYFYSGFFVCVMILFCRLPRLMKGENRPVLTAVNRATDTKQVWATTSEWRRVAAIFTCDVI